MHPSGTFWSTPSLPTSAGFRKFQLATSGTSDKSRWRNINSASIKGRNFRGKGDSRRKKVKTDTKNISPDNVKNKRAPAKGVRGQTEPSRLTDRGEQIELLKDAQEKSRAWMDQENQLHQTSTSTSKPIQTQSLIYEQLAKSRNKISSRLSDANKYISYMERRVETSNGTIQEAFECTEKVIRELGTLSQMVQSAAAIAKFGVNKDDALEKLSALQKRIDGAQKAVALKKDSLDALVPRRVPVSWYGVAMDVRIMGSFDNWTRGFELSVEDASDSVLAEFTTVLDLMPGTYDVKFIVNGEWKTAPDWPTVLSPDGSMNNVIVVD